jgi:hypothetical protein
MASHVVHTKFHENPSSHFLVIKCVEMNIMGNVIFPPHDSASVSLVLSIAASVGLE